LSAAGAEGNGQPLFTPQELARLERLRVRRRRTVRGEGRGEWRSQHYGQSGLFADHRAYVAGDDLRYVDWHVLGRLGDIVVKRFEAEENMNVLLCVDRSLSMEGAKSRAARRLAGALGYLALAHQDHARLAWLPGRARTPLTGYRGRGRTKLLLDELGLTPNVGSTDHVRDLGRIVRAVRGRGLAILVSDYFDPAGAIRGLALLRSRGLEVGAVHVVDPQDAELPLGTAIRAVDRETGDRMAIDVTPALAARVRRAWGARADALERWCLSREIRYLRVDARKSLWTALQDLLRPREGATW
jgi:uncharacterized protein (DUF58 family)